MSTYDVRLWDIRKKAGKRRPYEVRWVVAGREKSRSFLTKMMAEGFRAELLRALRAGEAFDLLTGLPEAHASDETWFDHACGYVRMKWPRSAAKSRFSTADSLAVVTMALVTRRRGRPEDVVLRRALFGFAFNVARADSLPEDVAEALEWLRQASLPVSSLREAETVRRGLDALAKTMSGRPAAATTTSRRRAVFHNALGYAVERRLLTSNPIDLVQWKAPEVAPAVDRRVVAAPGQVEKLLQGVAQRGRRGDHLVAFFGCLYYGGLRPSEGVALRMEDCWLPEAGWGRLDLARTEPHAGGDWTDSGQARDERQLKRRARDEVRPVPIPPKLVALLRRHIDRYGIGPDGRLFRSEADGPLQDTAYTRAWRQARVAVLTLEEAGSPLARRPYDLRHAAASLWLNSGVPATEVARRLGHGVAVLLRVYANCIEGQDQAVNDRISAALEPVDRGTLSGPLTGPPADGGELAGQVRDESAVEAGADGVSAGRRAGRAADGDGLENH